MVRKSIGLSCQVVIGNEILTKYQCYAERDKNGARVSVISSGMRARPTGIMLVLAYVIAVPIWVLSAPLIAIGNLSAWTARRRQIFSDSASS